MGHSGILLLHPGCETRWLTGKCAGLESEKSGLKTLPCHHSLSLSITLNILFTSPHPGVQMGTGEFSGKPDETQKG